MASPEMQPPLIELGQNTLTLTIKDRNIVVPRKELYGISDIGNAIGSDNPGSIRGKLRRARQKNPDIKPQHLGIGKRPTTLFLPEKDFVLAVTMIIPTIEGGKDQKESITLPDSQTITVRGEEKIRVLRLLINAFNKGEPYISNEDLLGFDITLGNSLSRMQKSKLSHTLGRLKYTTLTGTGWDIQSITVNGKGVETRPQGYTLKKENAQKVDAPTNYLQIILSNNTVLKELVTNGPEKTSIVDKAKQQINSLDPQEKVLFLEETFAILSDPNPGYQDQRDAALGLLRAMDLTSVNPKKLKKAYVKAVYNLRRNLNQDSDPYGEIHMLLEAGKTIAPFIKNSRYITQSWNRVANAFKGNDRQKILDDTKKIRQLIPKTLTTPNDTGSL